MKFIFFTTNLAGGGAEKALAKIASGLAQRNHAVDFIVCEDQGRYPPPPGCRFTALAQRTGHGWLAKRRLAWRLKRLAAEAHHDLFVSTLPFADEIAALAHLPRHVCRIANTLSQEIARLSPGKAARRQARYRAVYGATPLVAVSHGVAEDLLTHFGAQASRLRVIPNPFDFAALRTQAAAPCAARPRTPYIVHVGRFAAQKRHDLLLAAYAKLVSAGLPHRLILLTQPEARLAELIARHRLEEHVVIAGFQANPYPWMAGAELLVLCSDHEGLPNVLIEALACGTRVVSTDCPSGPREILTGELAQWLVPCNDAAALSATMHKALLAPPPSPTSVAAALKPYAASAVLDAWETLARELD